MRKFYLAHPVDARKMVRENELAIEERTGVELVNPFYDTGRNDIHEIDSGRRTRWEVSAAPIVEGDIKCIHECDAFVGVLAEGLSIGTIMEIVYAHLAKKRVFIIDLKGARGHPWIRYHSTRTFESWKEFEDFLMLGEYGGIV